MPPRFRAIKGTRDILPDAQARWNKVHEVARIMSETRGYRRIDTPIFEQADLFRHAVGDATDVVHKQMYSFVPREGREELVLRPEATASVCRAYIENGMNQEPKPVRLYYVGPMFRYENPQKGRWRQFHQFGAEQFGDDSPTADFGLILLAWSFLKALGLKDLVVKINTLGDEADRAKYLQQLREYYESVQLDDEARQRLARSPLRLLDAAEDDPHLMKLAENAPKITDAVNSAAAEHFQRLQESMEMYRKNSEEFSFEVDHKLVRGLDYYNRTVFEITPKGAKGRQSALIGGGRYDHLVEQLGGPPIPAAGFAAGLDRIVELLPEEEDQRRICLIYSPSYSDPLHPSQDTKLTEILTHILAESLAFKAGVQGLSNAAAMVAPKQFGKYRRRVIEKSNAQFVLEHKFAKEIDDVILELSEVKTGEILFVLACRFKEKKNEVVLEFSEVKIGETGEILFKEDKSIVQVVDELVEVMWGNSAKRKQ